MANNAPAAMPAAMNKMAGGRRRKHGSRKHRSRKARNSRGRFTRRR